MIAYFFGKVNVGNGKFFYPSMDWDNERPPFAEVTEGGGFIILPLFDKLESG